MTTILAALILAAVAARALIRAFRVAAVRGEMRADVIAAMNAVYLDRLDAEMADEFPVWRAAAESEGL
jgi:hypothetical protein